MRWERGASTDLGFVDSTPDWQSPDIAVIRPEAMDDAGDFEFPEGQNAPDEETFRVPADGEDPLLHRIAVRVWNFGDATAQNVQVGLIRKHPGGSGDWKTKLDVSQVLPAPLEPSASQVIAFEWPVASDFDTHVCFRARSRMRSRCRRCSGASASDVVSCNGSSAAARGDCRGGPRNLPPAIPKKQVEDEP